MPAKWKEIAARKRAWLESSIPTEWRLDLAQSIEQGDLLAVPRKCGKLSASELRITEENDATALLEQLAEGKLTSVEVVTAFVKRAAIAHQLTTCLTEFFPDEAIERATSLDKYFSRHGKPSGPLHGLPISLKDTFCVKNHDTSIGIAALAFNPSMINSTLVDMLLNAGAVLYCKTNVPQTLGQLDTHNNVFGRTLNPHNVSVTVGGSSGGEGALIAMRGSVLGVGTDIGGSIRIPAMANGLYGIKPSWQRVPYSGQQGPSLPGISNVSVSASAGPIATTLRDCEMFLRTISNEKPWESDPEVVFGDWNAQGTLSCPPLIGIVSRDGLIDPLPPVSRTIKEITSALYSSGVEVIDMDITALFSKCQSILNKFLGVDGGNHILDILESTEEPLSPWLITRLKRKNVLTLDQVRELHVSRKELEVKFMQIWKTKDGRTIDAFICPVAPHPVPPIDRWNGVSYTSAFVLLDYPAGVIPIRKFGPQDFQGEIADHSPLSSWDKVNRELWTKVDRNTYLNSPMGIQVVAPKLQERRLCHAMKVIDDALKIQHGRERNARL